MRRIRTLLLITNCNYYNNRQNSTGGVLRRSMEWKRTRKKGLKTIVAAVLALAFVVLAGCGNATRLAVEGVPETVLTAPKANGADSLTLSAPFFLSFRRSVADVSRLQDPV